MAAAPRTPARSTAAARKPVVTASPATSTPGRPTALEPVVEKMRIALFHGYELSGSGSNEYTKYVARGLARLGHDVHVICRDRRPTTLPFVRSAMLWTLSGRGGLALTGDLLFLRAEEDIPVKETAAGGSVTVHCIPHGPIRPVFVCDKQREGDVRAFTALTNAELGEYHRLAVAAVKAVLEAVKPQVVHANHLVYQPSVCAEACGATGVPFIIFPHGSSIEYTVQRDDRYRRRAKEAIVAAAKVISGNHEVAQRIERMYDASDADDAAALAAFKAKTSIVGVGTDTSLFKDVGFGKRAAKIANCEAYSPMFNGKTAEQRAELRQRLTDGGPEEWWTAMRGYRKAYKHKLPDRDFLERITALPWTHRAAVSQCPIIMFLGAMTVAKGIQTLIVSFATLLAKYPNAQLIIIGSGSYREVLEALVHALDTGNSRLLDFIVANGVNLDKPAEDADVEPLEDLRIYFDDPDRRAATMAAAKAGSLAAHVHFLGRVNHALLSCVFPCVDVAVFPSMLTEAYPLVLMESLANGVVPVLPDHSGFSESLASLRAPMGDAFVDSITMPSEPDRRVSGLAAVLDNLFDALDDMRSLTPKLRNIATTMFDWQQRCHELTAEYASVALPRPDDMTAASSPVHALIPAAAATVPVAPTPTSTLLGVAVVAAALGAAVGMLLQRKFQS